MKVILFFFILYFTACSTSLKNDGARVIVSFEEPQKNCQYIGTETISTNHFEKSESNELNDHLVSDLVTTSCSKNANYIYVSKIIHEPVKKGRKLSSDNYANKELQQSTVEGKYYQCP